MADASNDQPKRPDYFFGTICALVVVIVVWLLLMPIVPAIAKSTLRRFHLRTESFGVWAIQQPIPSMYNFANRYEVRRVPPDFEAAGFFQPIIEEDHRRYVNHFPTRIFTFANTRGYYLNFNEDRWLHIDSTYRGQTIQTVIHAKQRDDGGFDLVFSDGEASK